MTLHGEHAEIDRAVRAHAAADGDWTEAQITSACWFEADNRMVDTTARVRRQAARARARFGRRLGL